MLWTHPFLLAGLGALSIPILIHLLMRAQGRRVRFSTLRFLPKTKPARERKKIRHWPLLLLRLLMVALLVAAFARPYWPDSAGSVASHRQSRAVMLVLDRSASMQAREGGGTRWDAALTLAGKILDSLSDTDRVSVVAFDEQAEVIAPWVPPSIARTALSRLKVTSEPGRLADGLRTASALLETAPPNAELAIISDLQKSSCMGIDAVPFPSGTLSEIRPVGLSETANIAITGVASPGAASFALTAELHNFGTQEQHGLVVAGSLDHHSLFQGKIDMPAGFHQRVDLPPITGTPGWHQLEIDVTSHDALSADDQFFAAVLIPQPIRVLVAEPHPEKRIFARASYFLTSALDPNYSDDPAAPPAPGPFDLTVVDAANLPGALSANPRPSVVVLPSLANLPDGSGAALLDFVRKGGGLMTWIAADIDTLGYNNQFAPFTPARLLEPETYTDHTVGQGWRLGWWNRDSALFGPIGEAGQGDLTLPQFRQRARLDATPDAEVLATFADKVPFLITRPVGQGRVLLVNSSAGTDGSDWPIHKTYLPLVQRMAYYLARRDPQSGTLLGPTLTPSHHARLTLAPSWAKHPLQLIPPAGPALPVRPDDAGIVHDADLEQPGFYEIRDGQNQVLQAFTVNFPAVESDLSAYRPDEISNRLNFTAPAISHFSGGAAFAARRELWPWLLGALLPLLLLELAWANRLRA
jgi:hypothetical protein